jgi:hypothetical protein
MFRFSETLLLFVVNPVCWLQAAETAAVQKEMEKLKEEMSSLDYRIKWHQNKLKAELEAHKVRMLTQDYSQI